MTYTSIVKKNQTIQTIALIIICCVPTILYQWIYARSFYPITEGWFSQYAALLRAGQIPYVDFYLLLPPLYPLQLAAFQASFGEAFISLRYLGIVVTCSIGFALFGLLKGLFNRWAVALSVGFAMLYYQSGVAFLGYDFTQFLTLYLLIAGALLARYTKINTEVTSPRTIIILCVGIGLFLGLAVLIKQSNGGVATAIIGLVAIIVAVRLNTLLRAIQHVAWMGCGFLIPFVAIGVWLASVNALGSFINSVIVDALASKGGINKALFQWITDTLFSGHFIENFYDSVVQLGQVVITILSVTFVMHVVVALLARKSIAVSQANINQVISAQTPATSFLCGVSSILLCAIIYAVANGTTFFNTCDVCGWFSHEAKLFLNNAYIWGISLYVIGFVVALLFFLRSATNYSVKWVVVCGVGLGLMFGNGTSAGLSEISMFLGMALIFAFLFHLGLPRGLPLLLPLSIALMFAVILAEQKFAKPYAWWAVTSPDIRNAQCAEVDGIFTGLCIPVDQYKDMKRIEAHVRANSKNEDAIYVFPHMPVFSLMTHRKPFAGAVVSWFDFMSDRQALEVNNSLAANPPKVMIFGELPELVLTAHERLFRGGKPLGQRKIQSTISELLRQKRIKRIDFIKDINGLAVSVYVKTRP